ncbi:FKBP-type peptidyl-prolyl cis-trans isomerase [Qipengyuania marisflavi]|uniref:Peptidyl-prolyl cis-trans isomerase n=1 Tax=Qipengyuania marisflavi TaxID=2486356 RepID=A0A5S3P6G4_9SPHN|nr:FKBP-type peptidyl-prolyl cis-trans isomerase [Qipengyuania marisflavi]TMM48727.1 peptidylprolyl isomerase [Qipengyuania marisflavi]
MTEITRVPLQPVAKGSLTKLWLGVLIAVLIGAGLAFAAWQGGPRGVEVETIRAGTGGSPQMGDVVFVSYVGKLADGAEFDRSQPLPIPPGLFPDGNPLLMEEGAIIPGFLEGLQQMEKGGKYTLTIPADQAYGAEPPEGSPIPPNSDLLFEIELNEFMGREDFQRRAAALQQMMQAQQGQGAGPGQGPGQGADGPLGPPSPPAE